MESHEGCVGRDGVGLLDCRLAVPESSHHFEVNVGREQWVAQIGRVAVRSRRSRVVSSPGGYPDDN